MSCGDLLDEEPPTNTKMCSKCREVKSITDFGCRAHRKNGTIEFSTENINSNDYTKFFYDNSGNISKYSMEYRSGEMYQGSELKFYKNVTYAKDLYLYNYALDPKVLYYDKGELTKTEFISRETGEVIKATRIWRMKRRMKKIFYNIFQFVSQTK